MLEMRLRIPALVVIASLALTSITLAQLPEIHYLQLNEGAGTTTADLASPGLPGSAPTLNGAATWNTANPMLGAAALTSLTGGADSVRTNTPLSVSGDWTIEMYLYDLAPSSNTGLGYFMGDSTAGSFRAFRGGVAGVGNVILRGPVTDVTITGANVQNTWVHIAWVYDSVAGQITPYLNGTPQTPVAQGAITLSGTDPLGLAVGGYGSSAGFNGYVDEFRFWNRVRTTAEIQAFLNTELITFPDDLAVTSVLSPTNPPGVCDTLSSSETVTAGLVNLGTNPILAGTPIGMAYTADGGMTLVTETLIVGTTLNQFDTTTFTFAATLDLSVPATYTIDVTATLPADQNMSNDTRSTTVSSGGMAAVSAFPFTESFDGYGATNGGTTPPPGWIQDQSDGGGTGADLDWYFRNTPTTSANTGPPADHTTGVVGGGFYGYVEDTGNHPAVNLETPCMDFATLTSPLMRFWVHSNDSTGGTNENFLAIDAIVYPGALVIADLIPPIGHLGNSWQIEFVNLAQFAGGVVQLRFRGRSDGGSTTHDIAIDDVTVFEMMPSNGQAPRPGLAVMDISDSSNGSGMPVPFGANGPYFTALSAGDQMDFMFEGELNQPVILLFGNLNPAAAAFPMAGQIDIGGPVDPVTGFPTGVSVLANGTVPSGFNVFFNTGPIGTSTVSFTVPTLPLGVLTTFQAIILNTQPFLVGLTNAVEVTIM